MKNKILMIVLLILMIFTGCSNPPKNEYKETTLTDFYFDTIVTITIYNGKTEKSFSNIINNCFEKCSEYENIISKTLPDSDTSKINSANGKMIKISDCESELIRKSLYYSELTDGAFDITIEPLSTLWNFGHENASLPKETAINTALEHVDYKVINISENKIRLSDANASIDFGGIAKGYIADNLKEYLVSEGVTSAIINLGGNILTVGSKADGSDYKIGITKPFYNGDYSAIVNISDKSVVTSGVYERYFYVNDKLYHHILDTKTGYPCNNGLYSVSIVSDSSVDGDALSTGCFVLGLESGMQIIESLHNTEAIFIDENYKIHLSSGLDIDSKNNITLK